MSYSVRCAMSQNKIAIPLVLITVLSTGLPASLFAKPNSYPGEHSAFEPIDPEIAAQRKADREKRKELRKQRRLERKKKRLDKTPNRSN